MDVYPLTFSTKMKFSSFCSVANNMSQSKILYTSWRCQWNAFQFHQIHLNKNAKCALIPFSTTCFQNSFKAFPNIHHGILWKAYWRTHIVSWEPEGHYYDNSKMFHWEPEGRYLCTMSYSDSALLALNWTVLNSDSTHLALNWPYAIMAEYNTVQPRLSGHIRTGTYPDKRFGRIWALCWNTASSVGCIHNVMYWLIKTVFCIKFIAYCI